MKIEHLCPVQSSYVYGNNVHILDMSPFVTVRPRHYHRAWLCTVGIIKNWQFLKLGPEFDIVCTLPWHRYITYPQQWDYFLCHSNCHSKSYIQTTMHFCGSFGYNEFLCWFNQLFHLIHELVSTKHCVISYNRAV